MFQLFENHTILTSFILIVLTLSFFGYVIKYRKIVTKKQLKRMKKDGIISTINNKKYVIIRLINVLIIAKQKKAKEL